MQIWKARRIQNTLSKVKDLENHAKVLFLAVGAKASVGRHCDVLKDSCESHLVEMSVLLVRAVIISSSVRKVFPSISMGKVVPLLCPDPSFAYRITVP